MIELVCPFCDLPSRVQLAALQARLAAFLCPGCGVVAELDPGDVTAIRLAA